MTSSKYDCVIIGAGMSGLAAGIRLAMFDKKVCILEKHSISGGLNSYYKRGKREFDVGLHALTNFSAQKNKKGPLGKLLKQLRIPYSDFKLNEQNKSVIQFPEVKLTFSNNIERLLQSIENEFPSQRDGFQKLIQEVQSFNEVALDTPYRPSKSVVKKYITDPMLLEMIFCPLLIYGSAWEDDMDFSQFVIMFKSIYLEGFMRPEGGVRTIINTLLEKYKSVGGEIRYRSGVSKIITKNQKISSVELEKGEVLLTDTVLSSAGHPETLSMVKENPLKLPPIGKMGFVESIFMLDKKPSKWAEDSTIIFYNNNKTYSYRRPETLFDENSAVICFPNNFQEDDLNEGVIRVTNMANYDLWKRLDRATYKEEKERFCESALKIIKKCSPEFDATVNFKDAFTPLTIEKYTGHFSGTVYGSPNKLRDGRTPIDGLFLCGTDQGFLGVIGSMLSGISMANLHGLMRA